MQRGRFHMLCITCIICNLQVDISNTDCWISSAMHHLQSSQLERDSLFVVPTRVLHDILSCYACIAGMFGQAYNLLSV